MLTQLSISNFAIIRHLEIHFDSGLNILSGETGAGKSIIINAVNLILGGRATSDLIRSGMEEARVEALFEIPENHPIHSLLPHIGLPENGDLLIKRTISREGRNRISINGSLATLQMLSKVGLLLISISGQHEHQLLLRCENHLFLLDDFGGLAENRLRLNETFKRYQSLRGDHRKLVRNLKESKEREDLTGFQVKEIEGADLSPGEDSRLEDEIKRLRNAEQLRRMVNDAYQTLYEREGAVLSDISHCMKNIEKGAEMDQRLGGIRDTLASAHMELEETALELRDLQKSIYVDPSKLELLEERLQLINNLKRKYGDSIEKILDFRDNLLKTVVNLDQKKEERKRLENRIQEMEGKIHAQATGLSVKRRKAAEKIEKAVVRELKLLDMGGTQFEVRFHPNGPDQEGGPENEPKLLKAEGYDTLEFMLSPNVGETLKPLTRIASGGELSRIMLALKTILARTSSVETIVFDEVDSGIGGATAEVLGEKLQSLADFHQILCITHLPQIASKGSTHFLVRKKVHDKRTQTIILKLGEEERVGEIARLLTGKVISPKAMAHAREMLGYQGDLH